MAAPARASRLAKRFAIPARLRHNAGKSSPRGGIAMRLVLTALIVIAGLFDLMLGIGFLLQPESSGATFFLRPNGTGGLAVLRADMTAFFAVAAVWMIWGAWKRNGDLLLVPADSKASDSVLRSIQARHFGEIIFYFVMTSATFGMLFFAMFFIVNLIFGWV